MSAQNKIYHPWLAPFAVSAALAITSASSTAHADSNAIRGPDFGRGMTFVFGWPEASRVLWFRPNIGFTQEVRVPWDAFGAGIGFRGTLVGRPRGWAWVAQASAGFLLTTWHVGMALTASVSTQIRLRTERIFFAMGTAVPMAYRLNSPNDMRVPVQGELWFAAHTGPFWFGVQTAIGAAFSPGQNAGLVMQGGLVAALEFPVRFPRTLREW